MTNLVTISTKSCCKRDKLQACTFSRMLYNILGQHNFPTLWHLSNVDPNFWYSVAAIHIYRYNCIYTQTALSAYASTSFCEAICNGLILVRSGHIMSLELEVRQQDNSILPSHTWVCWEDHRCTALSWTLEFDSAEYAPPTPTHLLPAPFLLIL